MKGVLPVQSMALGHSDMLIGQICLHLTRFAATGRHTEAGTVRLTADRLSLDQSTVAERLNK
jgi:hypothetical protein